MGSFDATAVRDRIQAGMNVRIAPLAACAGLSHQAIRLAIGRGEMRAVRLGRAVMIPAADADRLLGMPVPMERQHAA